MTPAPNTATGAYLPTGHLLQDRYRIVGEVGRGGYSVVYRAEDLSVGSHVAVKLLVPPPATAHIARERMRREVRAARGLAHPHIVAVHDFLEEGPWSFIVMELVDGEDLATHVARRGVMDPDDVARLGSQIADALAVAHQHGVLHRDVKPQNILLDNNSNARLVDFGSARLDGLTTMTQTGGIVGTIAYAAPEVLAGNRGDARSDVYALGMTLTFSLVGKIPQRPPGQSTVESQEGFHPKRDRPETPAWLDYTIARSTSVHASRRFPTAESMRLSLDDRDGHFSSDTANIENASCLICGAVDPFDLGLCIECAGSNSDADTLVFLKPSGKSNHDLRDGNSAILGRGHTDSEIEEALGGERALVRVPCSAADHIVSTLAKRSIPSFAVHKNKVGRALPKRFFGLLAAVIGVGMLTGMVLDPRLIVASPTIALLLYLLAARVAQRPLIETPQRRSNLPSETESRVAQTLTSLPAGTARDLLAELVRLVDRAYKRVTSAAYNEEVAAAIVDLTEGACDVAVDIAECDEQLRNRQPEPSWDAAAAVDWLVELNRLERIRDRLVQQFLNATSVVTRLRNDVFEMDDTSSATITQAAANLKLQIDASVEVERLLA